MTHPPSLPNGFSRAVEMFAWFLIAYGSIVIAALLVAAATGIGFGSLRIPKPPSPATPGDAVLKELAEEGK